MFRLFVALAALVASSSAFTAPAASVVASQSARASVSMFSGSKKASPKAAKKAAPAKKAPVAKKAPAKKSGGKTSTEGKGGIFPWVTNEPGTYAKPLMLSSLDFLGADGDKWIGWGAMPDSVKKLYNRKGRKGLLKQ